MLGQRKRNESLHSRANNESTATRSQLSFSFHVPEQNTSTGEILAAIGRLSSLQVLRLHDNALSGERLRRLMNVPSYTGGHHPPPPPTLHHFAREWLNFVSSTDKGYGNTGDIRCFCPISISSTRGETAETPTVSHVVFLKRPIMTCYQRMCRQTRRFTTFAHLKH